MKLPQKVILSKSNCAWMLKHPGIYQSGATFDQATFDEEMPYFLLGVIAEGLPGKITKKSPLSGCYLFESKLPGLEKLQMWVDRRSIKVL